MVWFFYPTFCRSHFPHSKVSYFIKSLNYKSLIFIPSKKDSFPSRKKKSVVKSCCLLHICNSSSHSKPGIFCSAVLTWLWCFLQVKAVIHHHFPGVADAITQEAMLWSPWPQMGTSTLSLWSQWDRPSSALVEGRGSCVCVCVCMAGTTVTITPIWSVVKQETTCF